MNCECSSSSMLGEAFGDIVCTEGDCVIGEALIKSLVKFFDSVHRPRQFEAAVEAVYAAWEAENAKFTRKIPFSSSCCAIKELGAKAQQLQAQIAAATHVATVPGVQLPGPSAAVIPAVTAAAPLALLGGACLLGLVLYFKSRSRR